MRVRINSYIIAGKFFTFFSAFVLSLSAFAQTSRILLSDSTTIQYNIGKQFLAYYDKTEQLTINDFLGIDTLFEPVQEDIPNFHVALHPHWLKSTIVNLSDDSNFVLQIDQPSIDFVDFFLIKNDSVVSYAIAGDRRLYAEKTFPHTTHLLDFKIARNDSLDVFIKVKGGEHIRVPINIGSVKAMSSHLTSLDILIGVYMGIIFVMALYNLFVYITVKDNSYLYYVCYILIVGFTQINFQGYAARIFWPDNEWLSTYAVYFLSTMVAIASIEFMRVFLHTKINYPSFSKVIPFIYGVYAIAIIAALYKYYTIAYMTIQFNASIAATYLLVCAIHIMKKGYRPARFFVYAWAIFLIGVVVYVSKDYGLLPYNKLTVYLMPIGTALEVTLLSFALADKINMYRKEKELSQAEALRVAQENERIIKEQNIILEQKVTERTVELKASNDELNKTLVELKQTQTQLVEQEKMASLGQLTAGIAHEINNPINFVLSNVKPMKRDIDILFEMIHSFDTILDSDLSKEEKSAKIKSVKDECDFDYLKTEIDYLLKGISEGSSRTAEIVKGLRIFSRVDEDDIKIANINEGIDSTIIICNNLLGSKIEVVRQYDPEAIAECYPGKLNQVFMNIITNGIYAVKARLGDQAGGRITLSTRKTPTDIVITIADNGTGMNELTQKKLFEPFYTTKPVGEGTGLGLSIAYNTIKKHNGVLSVKSTLGEGTEFIITIPIKQ